MAPRSWATGAEGGDVTGVGRGSGDGALCVFRLLWSLSCSVLPAALEPVALAVHFQDVGVVGEPVQQRAVKCHGL